MREHKPNAKLNPEQVRAILLSDKRAKLLAYEYGVTPAAVSCIRTGKTWREVFATVEEIGRAPLVRHNSARASA